MSSARSRALCSRSQKRSAVHTCERERNKGRERVGGRVGGRERGRARRRECGWAGRTFGCCGRRVRVRHEEVREDLVDVEADGLPRGRDADDAQDRHRVQLCRQRCCCCSRRERPCSAASSSRCRCASQACALSVAAPVVGDMPDVDARARRRHGVVHRQHPHPQHGEGDKAVWTTHDERALRERERIHARRGR